VRHRTGRYAACGALRAVYGNRFPAPEEKRLSGPLPSGLLGDVMLAILP
jgi:hypothetical protein